MSKRKLVMEEHDGNVLVGVLQDNCDPVIKTMEGSIEQVMNTVPDFLKEAQEKWTVQPKNPAYKPPEKPKAETKPEAVAEEKPAEAQAEEAEPMAAPAETEPEPTVPPAEPEAEAPAEGGQAEDKAEAELSERIAQTPAPAAAQAEEAAAPAAPSTAGKAGEWEYILQDGRGPFGSVQEAMDALGLDQETRPQHNRWDRLSTALKEKIQRRPKA